MDDRCVVDTPRTLRRKEICQRRLVYFNNTSLQSCLDSHLLQNFKQEMPPEEISLKSLRGGAIDSSTELEEVYRSTLKSSEHSDSSVLKNIPEDDQVSMGGQNKKTNSSSRFLSSKTCYYTTDTRNVHMDHNSLGYQSSSQLSCDDDCVSSSSATHGKQSPALTRQRVLTQEFNITAVDCVNVASLNGLSQNTESKSKLTAPSSRDDYHNNTSPVHSSGELVMNKNSTEKPNLSKMQFHPERDDSPCLSNITEDITDNECPPPHCSDNVNNSLGYSSVVRSNVHRDINPAGGASDISDLGDSQANSELYKSVDNNSLKILLGQDRFERMLKNFEDCDDDGTVMKNDDDDDGDLELKTHRPDVTAVYYNYTIAGNPNEAAVPANTKKTKMTQSIKCAFAAEDVYREASAVSSILSWNSSQANYRHGRDDYDGSISEVSSSLMGREIRTLRQQPYGPIPQKTTERSAADSSQTKCHLPEQTESDQRNTLLDKERIRSFETCKHDPEENQVSHKRCDGNLENVQSVQKTPIEEQSGYQEGSFDKENKENISRNNQNKCAPGTVSQNADIVSDVMSDIKPVTDENSLYSEVTSAIGQDEGSCLTERMERLGISLEFLKKSTTEPNYVVEKVVPVKVVQNSTDGSIVPQPATSLTLPKPSVSETCKQNTKHQLVKICPGCAGFNRPYMDWCTNCGEVLIGIDPVPSAVKNIIQLQTTKWIESEKQANRTNPVNKNTIKEKYDGDGDAETAISRPSKDELCLDLEGACEAADSEAGGHNNKMLHHGEALRKGPNRSEEITFVYEDSDNPNQSLSSELKAELSINLRESQSSDIPLVEAGGRMQNVKSAASPKPSNRVGRKTSAKTSNKKKLLGLDVGVSNISCEPTNHGNAAVLENVHAEYVAGNEDIFKEFVSRLKADSRFKASADEPKRSVSNKRRPRSAGCRQSIASSQSKNEESLDGASYARKWVTSSPAWNVPDVSKSLVLQHSRSKDVRRAPRSSAQCLDTKRGSSPENLIIAPPKQQRPYSAGKLRTNQGRRVVSGLHSPESSLKQSPSSCRRNMTTASSTSQGGNIVQNLSQSKAYSAMVDMGKYMSLAQGYTGKLYEKDNIDHDITKQAPARNLSQHTIKLMSPRIQIGELSMMLCLPEEIILKIFHYLSHADLIRCAAVCTSFKRIALDPCLWKKIILKKKDLTDSWLAEIGSKKPASISLIQCTGARVSTAGLRELFRQCAEHLQELNFTGCQQGHLTGERILLHVTNRCRHLTHVDGSWTNVDDCGVMALADSCYRLETLCLNGCPTITDEAVHVVVVRHGAHLRTLELFGCFNLTQTACSSITKYCKGLITLNLGQCWKIPDTSLCQLTACLGRVEHLDLRGCKQMKDSCVWHIVRNCPRLETLALANCPNLTDSALTEIATLASGIKSLDVCGCKKLTDVGIKAIATGCHCLQYLDVSTTAITHKGVTSLANYCNQHLEVFKINFCKQITISCLVKLARHCRRLKKLYLYGLTGIRDTNKIIQENANLWVEM